MILEMATLYYSIRSQIKNSQLINKRKLQSQTGNFI